VADVPAPVIAKELMFDLWVKRALIVAQPALTARL